MSAYQDGERSHRGVSAGVTISPEDRAAADRQAAVHRQLAWASRIRVAHQRVLAIAMELAQDGLPAPMITGAMLEAGTEAGAKAAAYIADYDERAAREWDDDTADMKDDYAYGVGEEVAT